MGTSVGKTVRAERTRQGIPVRELARRLGVSPSFLSQFELGQSQAAVNTLFAIATELNLSLDVLLGKQRRSGTGNPHPKRRLTNRGSPTASPFGRVFAGNGWRTLPRTITSSSSSRSTSPAPIPHRAMHRRLIRVDDYGYVLEGTLTIDIDGMRRLLKAGEGDTPGRERSPPVAQRDGRDGQGDLVRPGLSNRVRCTGCDAARCDTGLDST